MSSSTTTWARPCEGRRCRVSHGVSHGVSQGVRGSHKVDSTQVNPAGSHKAYMFVYVCAGECGQGVTTLWQPPMAGLHDSAVAGAVADVDIDAVADATPQSCCGCY
jgi:hypothetical protein